MSETTVVESDITYDITGEPVKYNLPVLLFKNPVFHPGLNVTVRNGTKWLNPLIIGKEIEVRDTDKPEEKLSTVTVIHSVSLPFFAIPSIWLKFEHDPACRNLRGLLDAMDDAYGRDNWGGVVTVVFFWVGDFPDNEEKTDVLVSSDNA